LIEFLHVVNLLSFEHIVTCVAGIAGSFAYTCIVQSGLCQRDNVTAYACVNQEVEGEAFVGYRVAPAQCPVGIEVTDFGGFVGSYLGQTGLCVGIAVFVRCRFQQDFAVCVAYEYVAVDVAQRTAFYNHHFIRHAYIARSVLEVGSAAQGNNLVLVGSEVELGFPTEIIVHQRSGSQRDFNARITYLACVNPTVRALFGGSVYANQLVLGVGTVEREVEIQTAVEELPFGTYFDGIADFRFQVFCKVIVDGFYYATCRDSLCGAGDADGKVVTYLRP